jgi:putative phosphoribosyl transferase
VHYRKATGNLILALPRGGVPIAFEVSTALGCELDLLLVRKLGTPDNPEIAMGAIASGGIRVLNQDIIQALGLSAEVIEAETARENLELARRAQVYRGDRPLPIMSQRTVILIDDGIATGATMRAAIAALRTQHPHELVVAVPVAPRDTIEILRTEADSVICLAMPEPFGAVGRFYRDFAQVTDNEVREYLNRAWQRPQPHAEPMRDGTS